MLVSSATHAITFIQMDECENIVGTLPPPQARYQPAALVDSVELSTLMEMHNVTLPRTQYRAVMSDRSRARERNLKGVLPALINRKVKMQISYDDGHNAHLLASIRAVTEQPDGTKMVTITLEGAGDYSSQQVMKIKADHITALNGINEGLLQKATRHDLESVRAFRATERSLLGKRVMIGRLQGILVAASVPENGQLKYLLEPSIGHYVWTSETGYGLVK